MKKTSIFAGVLVTGMLLSCGLNAFGQQKEPPTTAPATPELRVTRVSPQGEKPPPGASTFSFVSSEFAYDGRMIKGSPYSAEAVTETTQILSDGNRIVNRSTASLYRDGEGRTRREQSLKSISGVVAVAQPLRTIMISDPVAGVSYLLDLANRTARKTPMGSYTFQTTSDSPGGANTGGATFVFAGNGAEGTSARAGTGTGAVNGNAVAPQSRVAPAVSWTAQSEGGGGYTMTTSDGRIENLNKEDLGTQIIEGVTANGTRHTVTIPAGQIGNERAIEIVDERWYSKDLQAFVMTRHSDPRSGETVYRLTNINRGEPDHSLFEVPADYQIKDNTPPVRTRKPE